MLTTLGKVVYQAFGLSMCSEIPLPEVPEMQKETQHAVDVVIKYADLTAKWEELAEVNRHFIIKENMVMFQVPNTATYLIENGNKIFVSPMIGSVEEQIRLFILGTCMGALLLQRKILPLHGSAIAIDGKAYAIVGDSGAGKSTLASAFLKKGYQLLSDDVIPIVLSSEGIPIIRPAYPQQKLWQESLEAFGMGSNQYQPIFDREMKFAVPVTSQFASNPLPLVGIFELTKTDNHRIYIKPIATLERLHTLFYHTYRNFFITRLGLIDWHFKITAEIANKVNLYQIQRPINRFTANELTSMIINTIQRSDQ